MERDLPHYSSASFIPVLKSNETDFPVNVSDRDVHAYRNDNRTFLQRCCDVTDAVWKRSPSTYTYGIIGLHEEITDFYEVMRPKEQETEIRLKVIEHITSIVHSLWPLARVEIFGSLRTGLYLPSSDIDIVIFGEWKSIPLSTLSQALQNNGILKSDINIIANASVPIVRLVHSPSGIKVDISFNMENGVNSAKLIKKLMKDHPSLPKLVLLLKQFLLHRNLNEVYNGGMSSYCLTLLIVSFLKGHHKPKCEPSVNLGTLLLEFFEHYGINFNYQKVSIHFQEDALYKPRLRRDCFLSVEDPLIEGRDIAKGTYLMHILRISFQNAFHLLSKVVNESAASETSVCSFLHLILQVNPDVMEQRQLLLRNHSKIMKTLYRLIRQSQGQSEESSNVKTKSRLKFL